MYYMELHYLTINKHSYFICFSFSTFIFLTLRHLKQQPPIVVVQLFLFLFFYIIWTGQEQFALFAVM